MTAQSDLDVTSGVTRRESPWADVSVKYELIIDDDEPLDDHNEVLEDCLDGTVDEVVDDDDADDDVVFVVVAVVDVVVVDDEMLDGCIFFLFSLQKKGLFWRLVKSY